MSRTRDQWIEKTGGFRLGESPEQFKARVSATDPNFKLIAGWAREQTDPLLTQVWARHRPDGEIVVAIYIAEREWVSGSAFAKELKDLTGVAVRTHRVTDQERGTLRAAGYVLVYPEY